MRLQRTQIDPAPAVRRWPPRDPIVIDRRGLPVDVSGTAWRLNNPLRPASLNWAIFPLDDSPLLDGIRNYLAHLIKTGSEDAVVNAFYQIGIFARMPAFQAAAAGGHAVPYLAFSQARTFLGKEGQWKLHYARALYRWCTRLQFEGFDQSVLDRIVEWRIPGNPKGRAVRSHDVDEGPLLPAEISDIVGGLRAVRLAGTMPLDEQAALALALAFGANAIQYASMREEDFVALRSGDEVAGWIIKVPRHKKGHTRSRAEFRRRKLNGLFGEIVSDLIEWNGSRLGYSDDPVRPLFRKRRRRFRYLLDDEWQTHITAASFTRLLKNAVERLGALNRGGEPLHVTSRRFRYSLATRMVRNGASQAAVKDALDHSDLQNVSVYWEISSDIVEHLDSAMTLALAPHAQAFAGIVRDESEALRGRDPSSRRYLVDPETQQLEAVGTCGHFGFCNITAPVACYACVKFQAWMDGPHQEVLDMLLRRREVRRELGLHPKMVGIEDELIVAVQKTLARIEARRAANG